MALLFKKNSCLDERLSTHLFGRNLSYQRLVQENSEKRLLHRLDLVPVRNVPQLLRANSSEKTFEKNRNNPIEIQSEVLSQCESCIVYNLSLLIFALHSFQIANSLSPILQVFPSSSLLLFGRFFFSSNIRYKVTTSGFKSGCQRKPGNMLKMSTEGGQQNKFIRILTSKIGLVE